MPFLEKLHRDVLAGQYDALGPLEFADYERMRTGWLDELKPARDTDRFADEMLCRCPSPGGPPEDK